MPNSNLTDEELVALFESIDFPIRLHKDNLYDYTAAIRHVTGFRCYLRQVEKDSEYYDLSIIEER